MALESPRPIALKLEVDMTSSILKWHCCGEEYRRCQSGESVYKGIGDCLWKVFRDLKGDGESEGPVQVDGSSQFRCQKFPGVNSEEIAINVVAVDAHDLRYA
jgi:hypothetical protein